MLLNYLRMLTWEFYAVNATTKLLWLFQTWSHEILFIVFVLGIVCMLGSSIYVSVKFVSFIFFITYSVVGNVVWFVFEYFRPPRLLSERSSQSPAIDRLLEFRNENRRYSSSDRDLNLPQSLALHPDQWSEFEARQARAPSSDIAVIHNASVRAPVRRSRRINRARVST